MARKQLKTIKLTFKNQLSEDNRNVNYVCFICNYWQKCWFSNPVIPNSSFPFLPLLENLERLTVSFLDLSHLWPTNEPKYVGFWRFCWYEQELDV